MALDYGPILFHSELPAFKIRCYLGCCLWTDEYIHRIYYLSLLTKFIKEKSILVLNSTRFTLYYLNIVQYTEGNASSMKYSVTNYQENLNFHYSHAY